MNVLILVLVVIATLLAIVSGVWVAIALITAITVRRPALDRRCQPQETSGE
jgi:hypothetical protein